MARELKPCGTHAAYVRHRENDEDCAECREAEAERARKRRAVRKAAEESVSVSPQFELESVRVEAVMRAGDEPLLLEVPSGFDPVESAKWRLGKIRAAMQIATPRDMGPLADREAEAVKLLAQLVEASREEVDPLDELRKRREAARAERMAQQSHRTGS